METLLDGEGQRLISAGKLFQSKVNHGTWCLTRFHEGPSLCNGYQKRMFLRPDLWRPILSIFCASRIHSFPFFWWWRPRFHVLVLFSKIWELPDGLFCHFLQKRSTNLAVLKGFCKKPNSHYVLLFYSVALSFMSQIVIWAKFGGHLFLPLDVIQKASNFA